MKRRILRIRSAILPALACVLVSCSGGDEGNGLPEPVSPEGVPLRFSTGSSGARAEITADNLRQFTVWSSMRQTDGASGATWMNVFGAPSTTVSFTEADGWTYPGGEQYWMKGYTYTFHALAEAYEPASTPEPGAGVTKVAPDYTLTSDGNSHYLSIPNFNGTQGTDLAYATEARDVTNNPATTSVVNLSFHHLTSRLEFWGSLDKAVGELGNKSVQILNVKVYGMNTIGTWSGASFNPFASNFGTWTSEALSTEAAPYVNVTYNNTATSGKTINANGSANLLSPIGRPYATDAVMMIPQEVPTDARLAIRYRYDATSSDRTVILNLYEASLSIGAEWLPGKSYKYIVNIGAADNIFFDTPTVEPWNYTAGGNIIIQ